MTAKTTARVTVMRFKFFSIIEVPEKVEGRAPPKASERPVPFPECKSMATINAKDTNIWIPIITLNITYIK